MKKLLFLLVLLVGVMSTSCKKGALLPNASGAVFEVLVVADDSVWKSTEGRELFDLLSAEMPDVPQSEPMFKISRVPHSAFDNLLRPARNIVIVDVAPHYTQPRVKFEQDVWARRQAVVTLTMPCKSGIPSIIEKRGKAIQEFFVKSERKTYQEYLQKSHNSQMESEAFKRFGIEMRLPFEMTSYKYGENFMWISDNSVTSQKCVVIYSYPYTDVKDLELERIIAKRDSVLKANIDGPDEGSYMGTELVHHTPSFKAVTVGNAYCSEVHGLWKVVNGMMGGPFVSHSRVDEINNRIITIEGFVFAPGKDKRNSIRQMEAILYMVKMPHEVNEVVVRNNK